MKDSYNGFADTVFLGCFWTQDLKKLDGFSEINITNQDSELNLRLLEEHGPCIRVSSDIKCWYYPRSSFKGLMTGMFQAILAAEAVKVAQKMSGKADITAAEMRVGMENLKVDQAMFSNLGLPNFAPNLSVSCDNHGGAGLVAVQQWDAKAKTWSLVSDFKPTDMDVINKLITEDSSAYAKENNITPKCL